MEQNQDFTAALEYPIDAQTLLQKKKRIRRWLLQTNPPTLHKKIAVLGGSTTNEVVDQLELFLLKYGIGAEFYQSEYGQYWQDAVFGTEQLDVFCPDLIYVHTNWRNISVFPNAGDCAEQVDVLLETEFDRWQTMWTAIAEKYRCPIIQNNFERPNFRLMGNRDIWDCSGRSNFISRLNQKFYTYAQQHSAFYINDIDYLSADYGLLAWSDAFYWHMYKYALTLEAVPILANNVAGIIKSVYGKNKKALALDLDNTLWGGVIGDDGAEGIAIGPEVPEGQVFSEFQRYCKSLKSIGVILTVNSKNEETNALLGLSHPDSVLQKEDFVCIKANWEPKSENILQTAKELNLGADSFVFADDNPAERELVKHAVPGIAVPDMTEPEHYIRMLDHGGYFEVTSFTGEDTQKTELYRAEAQRRLQQSNYASYDDYLDSLEMTAKIGPFEEIQIQRIAQLTNKSNQFNLTTLRCTEQDIRNMAQNERYICLAGRLEDKFGDNGIVSVVSGELLETELHIRLWLMSCRVLKRGMEDAMMNRLVKISAQREIKTIYGYYYPTAKNGMVKDFYARYGFEQVRQSENGETVWRLETDKYLEIPVHMKSEGKE